MTACLSSSCRGFCHIAEQVRQLKLLLFADCRTAMVGAGGISALVSALQDGSMRAKAAASRLLLGFAAEGPESQEWIAAAPGSIAALVDLLRWAS